MLSPYYEEPGITIYHGDSREVLPDINTNAFDLVLTDPPYLKLKGGLVSSRGRLGVISHKTITVHDPWHANLDWLEEAWRVTHFGLMVFCSFASVADIPPLLSDATPMGLVTWYKRNSPLAIHNVPRYTSEFIWLFKKFPGLSWRALTTTVFDIPMLQAGCMARERIISTDKQSLHPTQKPLQLMKRLLSVGATSVLDPFMGLGTTLLAAKELGIQATGIDTEEAYCESAVNRLRQEVFSFQEEHHTQQFSPIQMAFDD